MKSASNKVTLAGSIALAISAALATGCASLGSGSDTATAQLSPRQQVLENYANLAHAVYQDSLLTAKELQQRIQALADNPSEFTLRAARAAWKQARKPYQQSEVFRFGNAVVDDWEGQLNAWPLDEGLIDYVDASSYEYELGNAGAVANIIANRTLTVGSETIDATQITPQLLASLNEIGGSEANVATGYHAIEFLLWGQDLNGTAPGAGNRPYTDFVVGEGCTGGNCDRRVQYLQAAAELLVQDLEWMTAQWAPGSTDNYRHTLLQGNADNGLKKMLYGMGSLSLGELAGERMKVALEANSTEDEHDCFSDNTHYSHYYNAKGIQNVYLGQYRRVDGSLVNGTSLADLVAQINPQLDDTLQRQLNTTDAKLMNMVYTAEGPNPMKFDQMIAEGNAQGQQIVAAAIHSLVAQTATIEQVAAALGIQDLNPDNADHAF